MKGMLCPGSASVKPTESVVPMAACPAERGPATSQLPHYIGAGAEPRYSSFLSLLTGFAGGVGSFLINADAKGAKKLSVLIGKAKLRPGGRFLGTFLRGE